MSDQWRGWFSGFNRCRGREGRRRTNWIPIPFLRPAHYGVRHFLHWTRTVKNKNACRENNSSMNCNDSFLISLPFFFLPQWHFLFGLWPVPLGVHVWWPPRSCCDGQHRCQCLRGDRCRCDWSHQAAVPRQHPLDQRGRETQNGQFRVNVGLILTDMGQSS